MAKNAENVKLSLTFS